MALKKSDLYASLWESCDQLRGGMDASQYKDYILTLLFVKYVSDKYDADPYGAIVIPEGASWSEIMKLQGDPKIGEGINVAINAIAKKNDLVGVVDIADFNDGDKLGTGKDRQDRLSKLLGIFDGLEFGESRATGDDLLGDAYEYLMRHFATESGKSKGQFYTPAEVSRVLARVVGISGSQSQTETVYDPTCGSASLLLKAADLAPRGITIYGQENDNATWALAKMNMILHGYPTADIAKGNTLTAPRFTEHNGLKRFDYVVANPPFSMKAWSNGVDTDNDPYGRFELGVPPAKNGDYAFLLHMLASLKSTGTAATILPHGVLFRGNAEARIRENLLQRGYIKAVIGLPANLFFGTGIPACIVVIDKAHAAERDSVFMIDASRGFMKDGPKNRLRERDIHKIIDVFENETVLERYSRLVPIEEIASEANGYNLNIARYVDPTEPVDTHDLHAHLRGGIPSSDVDDLVEFWKAMPTLRDALFTPTDRSGYEKLVVEASELDDTIKGHPDYWDVAAQIMTVFDKWAESTRPRLAGINADTAPKELYTELAEDLLGSFAEAPLLDRYAVYQAFADYWSDTMDDDVVLVSQVGWEEAATPRIQQKRNNKWPEPADITIGSSQKQKRYKTDLLKPGHIIGAFLSTEQEKLETAERRVSEIEANLEEFAEEHSEEGGALDGLEGQRGGISVGEVRERVDQLKAAVIDRYGKDSEYGKLASTITKTSFESKPWKLGVDDPEELFAEIDVLYQYLVLNSELSDAKSELKTTDSSLREAVLEHYQVLDDETVRDLTIDEKWLKSIRTSIVGLLDDEMRALGSRLHELHLRYDQTLDAVADRVEALTGVVREHLDQVAAAR